jgi:hypothetical protein
MKFTEKPVPIASVRRPTVMAPDDGVLVPMIILGDSGIPLAGGGDKRFGTSILFFFSFRRQRTVRVDRRFPTMMRQETSHPSGLYLQPSTHPPISLQETNDPFSSSTIPCH